MQDHRGFTDAPDVLVVVRGRDRWTHPGVVAGLERMVSEGTLRGASTIPIDPRAAVERHAADWRQITDHVQANRTELVVLHHFHSPLLPDPRAEIEGLRGLPHHPLVALTNGDAFFDGFFRPAFPKMFLQAAEVVDVVLSTSMGVSADHIADRTAARMSLLPNGVCQVRFARRSDNRPAHPEFLVAFIGSNNRPRNPLRMSHWYARRRERLVRKLQGRFGARFAVFGNGWEGIRGWQGPVPFDQQVLACQRAAIVVGGVPLSPATYYTSNRPFIQISSGVPFVDLAVEGAEKILRDGEHWHLVNSIDEMVERCDALLTLPVSEREELGAAAADYVLRHHTHENRWRSLVSTLTSLRTAQLEGGVPPPPDMRFFLPEVDRSTELSRATRAWERVPQR